jgi:hypothetical protein
MAAGKRWDALQAVEGSPLAALAAPGRGLPWEQARAVLTELASELRAALDDGSLPQGLTWEQIWLDRGGRIKLLDAPLEATQDNHQALHDEQGITQGVMTTLGNGDSANAAERAVVFFRAVLARLIEGGILPGHVRDFVEQLASQPATAETLAWARAQLELMAHRPAVLRWDHRLATLAVSASTEQTVYVTVAWMPALVLAAWPTQPGGLTVALAALTGLLAPWAVGYWLWGGPVFLLTGVQVRLRNGQPAGRLRCAWRNLLAWAPAMLGNSLLACSVVLFFVDPETGEAMAEFALNSQDGTAREFLALMFGWTALLALHAAGACIAFLSPRRGLQDFLAGTRLATK